MGDDVSVIRAGSKYVLSLLTALLVTIVVGVFLGGSPDPGTPQRLVLITTFFTVFTLLFVWDGGYLNR